MRGGRERLSVSLVRERGVLMTNVAAIIRGSWRLERVNTTVEWLVRRWAAIAFTSSLLRV